MPVINKNKLQPGDKIVWIKGRKIIKRVMYVSSGITKWGFNPDLFGIAYTLIDYETGKIVGHEAEGGLVDKS